MDEVHACSLSASGCVGGCVGEPLQKISAFFSCLEVGWDECLCTGGESRANSCITKALIDTEVYSKCRSNPSEIQRIYKQVNDEYAAGKYPRHWLPEVYISGKDVSNNVSTQDGWKKALCTAGVSAACGGIVLV
eukprot:gnl/MRDRNA2_/MRDRNA2_113561_c0_seq1.p1 gnl/MRDRNA2_/MRDRNA2_113561_c0~~gnl/MRDRNA2_/MRDRNA2_113561_c0_seq1.p1  ORF type:complete len:134 (+),score=19.65 gnl/MRDRNA2_/MRDRNA2_113561_c0_seq1:318-719(+)